jgi:hypothetical protein
MANALSTAGAVFLALVVAAASSGDQGNPEGPDAPACRPQREEAVA